MPAGAGAGDGHDLVALVQEPRQAELRRRDPPLGRHRLQLVNQTPVAGVVVALEARDAAAQVALGEPLGGTGGGREHPPADGAERDEADAQLADRGSTSASGSRDQSEYSDWTAATGWTACARRSCSAVTSDSPISATSPSSTSRAIAPTVSSSGTSGSRRWR